MPSIDPFPKEERAADRRNAIGHLAESMPGAGSPQARRVQIDRQTDVEAKKGFARDLAGVVANVPGEMS